MKKLILVLNAGSSSLKFSVFSWQFKKIVSGNLERIGLADPFLGYNKSGQKKLVKFKKVKNHQEALDKILLETDFLIDQVAVIGHRVVTGGHKFTKTVFINKKVFSLLKKNNNIAPLHNPSNMMGISACIRLLPRAKNVAVFDTSFYKHLPDYAYTYGLPKTINKKFHLRRYGFHGISHQYVAEQAADKLKKPLKKLNLISCHLGNGCSITAIKSGQAIDTSMGFTPLEGLLMGTRCGDTDPALVIFLLENLKVSPQQLNQLLNKKSGLLGISGISNDLREILIAAGYQVPGFKLKKKYNKVQKENAKLALSIYIYRIKKYVSAYYGILGRVDAVIFTAGTGERNANIRKMVMRGLPFTKKVKILAISTNEELMIAKQVRKFV